MYEKVSLDPSATTRSLLVAALMLLAIGTAGCNDGDNSGPTVPLSTPTRTPTPPVGLNGVWSGTVRYTSRVLFVCDVDESSVTANVTQEGSLLTGRLTADCWRAVRFEPR